jgi:pectate lyase
MIPAVWLVVTTLACADGLLEGQRVRVMQWNIEHALGQQSNNLSSSAQAIARVVNYNQPDVLLLNEVDAQNQLYPDNQAALVDWVINSLPYLGTQTFYVGVSKKTDGLNRNAAISRFPILSEGAYLDGALGLHAFQVAVNDASTLQVFQTQLKCCSTNCSARQAQAQIDADAMSAWAATNSFPYIFAGDLNEDEDAQPPVCTLTDSYHPITTIREDGGLVEFKPRTLDGEYRTWSTASVTPTMRFDYILAATNRLAPLCGYVFSSTAWAMHGLYTNVSTANLVNDSQTASGHYCVFADYVFPLTELGANDGFHDVHGHTTGGEGGPVITISNVAEFISAVNQTGPYVVQVQGTLSLGSGYINVQSDKTILGLGTNATLIGDLSLDNGAHNVIFRNLFFTNPSGAGDGDGLTIQHSHHVWVDHCTFYDCTDGELDITHGCDFMTVSWCKFFYTFDSGHNFVNLIGHDDANGAEDAGRLHVTFHHNWWSTLCRERMPRVRFGHVHSYNNYFNAPGNNYCIRAALESQILIEGDYFENVSRPWEKFITPGTTSKVWAVGNALVNVTGQTDPGADPVFTVPYTYTLDATSDLPSVITNSAGAGRLASGGIAFEQWQLQYFGCTNCTQAQGVADPDGDGQNNQSEFASGTNPTNSASALQVISTVRQSNDVMIAWTTAGGRTNAVQATAGDASGGYTTNFIDISSRIVIPGSGDATTNYTDSGGATNIPSRYYRVRLVP